MPTVLDLVDRPGCVFNTFVELAVAGFGLRAVEIAFGEIAGQALGREAAGHVMCLRDRFGTLLQGWFSLFGPRMCTSEKPSGQYHQRRAALPSNNIPHEELPLPTLATVFK